MNAKTPAPTQDQLDEMARLDRLRDFDQVVYDKLRKLQNTATVTAHACDSSTIKDSRSIAELKDFIEVLGASMGDLSYRIALASEEISGIASILMRGDHDLQP